jgi:hypothetical protein
MIPLDANGDPATGDDADSDELTQEPAVVGN